MSVVIRLARHGRKNLPFYRIVAADKQMKRDGRFLEQLGTLNTLVSPSAITLNEERVKYWISVGAQPSDTLAQYIEKLIPGHYSKIVESRLAKVRAVRAKRKAGGKKAATPAKKKAAAKKK